MRCAKFLCMLLMLCVACCALGEESSYDGSNLGQKIPGFRELGIDLSVWNWLEYGVSSQSQQRTSWANEFEIDVTKTFFDNRVSLAADIEFVDYDDDRYVDFEQLFTSILISRESGTLLTIGQFNAPFGVERRDFWDRLTGTPSLLFRAQPEDLRGVIATVPISNTGVTLQPFIVSGFGNENAIPGWPSTGLMATYKPNQQWTFAITNWIGPGLEEMDESSSGDPGGYGSGYAYGLPAKANEYGGYGGYGEYGGSKDSSGGESSINNSVWELTNVWTLPKFQSADSGLLYYVNVNATWKPRHDLTIQGQYLFATSNSGSGVMWDGMSLLASYELDAHWRTFAQYSFIDDPQGEVYDFGQQRQEVNWGMAYRFDAHWEVRGEYRHDWSTEAGGIDSVTVHLSVGY